MYLKLLPISFLLMFLIGCQKEPLNEVAKSSEVTVSEDPNKIHVYMHFDSVISYDMWAETQANGEEKINRGQVFVGSWNDFYMEYDEKLFIHLFSPNNAGSEIWNKNATFYSERIYDPNAKVIRVDFTGGTPWTDNGITIRKCTTEDEFDCYDAQYINTLGGKWVEEYPFRSYPVNPFPIVPIPNKIGVELTDHTGGLQIETLNISKNEYTTFGQVPGAIVNGDRPWYTDIHVQKGDVLFIERMDDEDSNYKTIFSEVLPDNPLINYIKATATLEKNDPDADGDDNYYTFLQLHLCETAEMSSCFATKDVNVIYPESFPKERVYPVYAFGEAACNPADIYWIKPYNNDEEKNELLEVCSAENRGKPRALGSGDNMSIACHFICKCDPANYYWRKPYTSVTELNSLTASCTKVFDGTPKGVGSDVVCHYKCDSKVNMDLIN